MPDLQFNRGSRFPEGSGDRSLKGIADDEDVFMEQILDNLNTTPIGKVLKRIAALPEVRQDKVLHMRQQLTQGVYRDGDHIEAALDRVLEDLMA
ncbi:hypothetical protein ACFL6U_07955 [Planctomycetota bacterium]